MYNILLLLYYILYMSYTILSILLHPFTILSFPFHIHLFSSSIPFHSLIPILLMFIILSSIIYLLSISNHSFILYVSVFIVRYLYLLFFLPIYIPSPLQILFNNLEVFIPFICLLYSGGLKYVGILFVVMF